MLSWTRISVALMTLGFFLDRFGLYLKIHEISPRPGILPRMHTYWMGLSLVLAGVFFNALSTYSFWRLRRRLKAEQEQEEAMGGSMLPTILLSIFITLIGLLTAVFLSGYTVD